ncbi:hypothetical protein MVEN_00088100 [Mycena venus]|uniref:FAR1 domain-containing protein n=1 Tax=Mycena venus TaxID=2733690 RepID=A0A8H6Z791_9AGAR|nr:hypothetical protein MVEN_00088100 [Mycena venus]
MSFSKIAISSIIEQWCFSNDIPTTAAGTVIQPGEHIPRFQDLHPIVREIEKAFADGARSVSLVLNVGGQRYDFQFHFSKIRLLVAINDNYPAVLRAHNVFRHTISNNLLSSTALDNFGGLRIFAPIAGFKITDFPLWKLACLLGETWLEEDVVNALLELAYLQETCNQPMILHAFSSPNPSQMTSTICSTRIPNSVAPISIKFVVVFEPFPLPVSFVTWRGDHFSSYRYETRSPLNLHHGDSMGRPANDNIWSTLVTSCGIAAVNFVTLGSSTSNTAPWTDVSSPAFRCKSIPDLVVYHLTCIHHEAPVEGLARTMPNCPAGMEELNILDDGPVSFNDFNLHRPTIDHPIHSFWENVKKEPLVELPAPPKPSSSQRVPPLPKLAGVSVNPAVIILDSDSEEGSDDDSVIDLTCSSPVIKQETTIDLTHTSPSPLLLAGMIVLQDPNEDANDIVVISDLRPICSASSTQPQKPKLEPLSNISNSQRPPLQIIGDINIGKTYNSFEEEQADIYALEARRGHIWQIAQTKKVNDVPKRITLRCNHYYQHTPSHLHTINHRCGKSIKTDCMAHVNLTRSAADGTWHVSFTDWMHNHSPQIPSGGCPTASNRSTTRVGQ